MICKNCEEKLENNAQFCDNCGAKVIVSRITFKQLVTELVINVFGIDSKFFLTLKKMVTSPDEVLTEYLTGVRKKYVNPFAFLAIGAGLSLIIFNYFADDFINMQSNFRSEDISQLRETANLDVSAFKNVSKEELQKMEKNKKMAQKQLEVSENIMQFMLRYYNLLTFLFLPFYALLSKWTYRKPHNFGEHIVMNSYLYGLTTYFSIIAFFAAMLIHPSIYFYSIIAYILYYLYAFKKLYKLSIGTSVLKFFRFLIGVLMFGVILSVLIAIIVFILAKFGLIKF
ncbi:DUF3667 domain-containing protein [uncultured Polaribacter sp.]|uniref:DUF3667 domain-containing protein n=1 Tax=uncultured Polaribacter sp. TaxID=174711 RepID=UPI00260941FA|nr:DUF3667 domain-containing protein [uncultured Polaribacter sp.]